MTAHRYSAFDVATKTGVAYGIAGQVPILETWDMSRPRRGATGLAMLTNINRHLRDFRPDVVFIEAPLDAAIQAKIGATFDTMAMLVGLPMIIETVCESLGIPTRLYRRQDVLMHFVGQAKFKVKNGGKMACQSRCRQLKWPAGDWEQGDAAALWDYGCQKVIPAIWLQAQTNRPARMLGK